MPRLIQMINSTNTMVLFQFVNYLVIGLFTNTIGYVAFLTLTYFGVEIKLAASCLYLLCAILSFIGNRNFTFNKKGSFSLTDFYFLLTYLLGYLINMVLLIYFVDQMRYPYSIIEAIAIVVVSIFIFLTSKLFIFSDTRKLS